MLATSILSMLVAARPAASSTASRAPFEGKPRVRATLISEVTQVEPGGSSAWAWSSRWSAGGSTVLASEAVQSGWRPDPAAAGGLDAARCASAGVSRPGVPMSLMHAPTQPDQPEVLAEALTTDGVVSALGRAAAAGQRSLGLSSPP